jgi:hypothetical protein
MRRVCLLALSGLLLTDIAAADIVRRSSVPRSYVGSWTPSDASCEAGSKAVIVLSAKRYVSSEMKCDVLAVYETPGEHGPIYSARMRCSRAAGAGGKAAGNLIIMPTGTGQLSVGFDFNDLKSYQRC